MKYTLIIALLFIALPANAQDRDLCVNCAWNQNKSSPHYKPKPLAGSNYEKDYRSKSINSPYNQTGSHNSNLGTAPPLKKMEPLNFNTPQNQTDSFGW